MEVASLKDVNPIDNLAPLAKAGVKIYHIHGTNDDTVPMNSNSTEFAMRYKALGGEIQVEVIEKGDRRPTSKKRFSNPWKRRSSYEVTKTYPKGTRHVRIRNLQRLCWSVCLLPGAVALTWAQTQEQPGGQSRDAQDPVGLHHSQCPTGRHPALSGRAR